MLPGAPHHGINLANVSGRCLENFDREAIILWLLDRRAAGESLVFSKVCLEYRDKALAISNSRSNQRSVFPRIVVRRASD